MPSLKSAVQRFVALSSVTGSQPIREAVPRTSLQSRGLRVLDLELDLELGLVEGFDEAREEERGLDFLRGREAEGGPGLDLRILRVGPLRDFRFSVSEPAVLLFFWSSSASV